MCMGCSGSVVHGEKCVSYCNVQTHFCLSVWSFHATKPVTSNISCHAQIEEVGVPDTPLEVLAERAPQRFAAVREGVTVMDGAASVDQGESSGSGSEGHPIGVRANAIKEAGCTQMPVACGLPLNSLRHVHRRRPHSVGSSLRLSSARQERIRVGGFPRSSSLAGRLLCV